jgi:phosphatidylinositol-bisphosphatase
VATGLANTLGNKGGVAISMCVGATKFVFADAHLAAHQNAVKRRNAEYDKLRRELPVLLAKKEKGTGVSGGGGGDILLLETCADRVVFMGDLNYRVRGNRAAVDKLLDSDMHDVMQANDQLQWSMRRGFALAGFTGERGHRAKSSLSCLLHFDPPH